MILFRSSQSQSLQSSWLSFTLKLAAARRPPPSRHHGNCVLLSYVLCTRMVPCSSLFVIYVTSSRLFKMPDTKTEEKKMRQSHRLATTYHHLLIMKPFFTRVHSIAPDAAALCRAISELCASAAHRLHPWIELSKGFIVTLSFHLLS